MTGLPTCRLARENCVLKCLFGTTQKQVHHRVDILTLLVKCVSVAHSTSVETNMFSASRSQSILPPSFYRKLNCLANLNSLTCYLNNVAEHVTYYFNNVENLEVYHLNNVENLGLELEQCGKTCDILLEQSGKCRDLELEQRGKICDILLE